MALEEELDLHAQQQLDVQDHDSFLGEHNYCIIRNNKKLLPQWETSGTNHSHLTHWNTDMHEFVCFECVQCFPTQISINMHIRQVHIEKCREKCPICNKRIQGIDSLNKHYTGHIHSKRNTYKPEDEHTSLVNRNLTIICPLCFEELEIMPNMDVSITAHLNEHSGDVITCVNCSKGFLTFVDLIEHLLKCVKEIFKHNMFKCDICVHHKNQTSRKNDSQTLKQHKESRTHFINLAISSMDRDEGYQCPLCPSRFSTTDGILEHLSLVCWCSICDSYSECYDENKLHQQDHIKQGTNIYTLHDETVKEVHMSHCPFCLIKFAHDQDIKEHLTEHYNQKLQCKRCSHMFLTVFTLNQHIQRHLRNPKECQTCLKVFPTELKLKQHKCEPNKQPKHSCSKCPQTFVTSSAFVKHMNIDHEVNDFRGFSCSICSKTFKCNAGLKAHSICHGDRNFPCTMCSNSFFSIGNLRTHMNTHSSQRHSCSKCTRAFSSKDGLRMHMCTQMNQRPYPCSLCTCSFMRPSRLKAHMGMRHHIQRPYPCSRCTKSFMHRQLLARHVEIRHSSEKQSKCCYCPEVLEWQQPWYVHMNDKHCEHLQRNISPSGSTKSQFYVHTYELLNAMINPFTECPFCFQSFEQTEDIEVHLRQHSGEIISCKRCPAHFPTILELYAHSKLHTVSKRVKQFLCHFCSRQFDYSVSLKHHEKCHKLLTTKYPCQICSKTFNTASNLGIHTQYFHKKTPPLATRNDTCHICSKSFNNAKNLTIHTLSHKKTQAATLATRNYTCHVCSKLFNTARDLRIHKLSHKKTQAATLATRNDTCHICSKSFNTARDLRIHKLSHKKTQAATLAKRNYNCQICTKHCKTMKSLIFHTSSHDKFECIVCAKMFVSRRSFSFHMKHVHAPRRFF